MHYSFSKTLNASDCIIVGLFKNQALAENHLLTSEQQVSLQTIVDAHGFSADVGKSSLQYFVPGFANSAVLILGLGDQEKYTLAIVRKVMAAAGKQLIGFSAPNLQVVIPCQSPHNDRLLIRQSIICLEDANISRDQLKTKPAELYWPKAITFVGDFDGAGDAIAEGQAIAAGIKRAKYLANLPANKCTPSLLANYAVEMTKTHPNLEAEIYDEQAIKELKMGCLLAVAQGSVQPPRLIVLHYRGADDHQAPTVLLGKGITFDSGGISLKPGSRMDEMKYDMSGAAAVLGTLQAIAELKLPINVKGIAVCSENLPSGSAVKPGDVVVSMSGKTVEGRLVLSDGLTFAERFKPKAVIDLATLTGAIVVTLGAEASGLMTNNEALAEKVTQAGIESGDRTWQLPLWEEYQALIDSAFADVANLGNDQAKSITAGCFLARFAENFPWVHLDIAGIAYQGGSNLGRAASGRPVSLLMNYFLNDK
jgi:leucyl aminopeptidase